MKPSRSVTMTSGRIPKSKSLATAEPDATTVPSVPFEESSSSREGASPTTVATGPNLSMTSSSVTRSELTVTAFRTLTAASSEPLS